MSGRHRAGPVGSGAREATASPYHGRHRATEYTWQQEQARANLAAWMALGWQYDSPRPEPPPECVHPGDGCGHECDCPCDWCEAVQARLRGDEHDG